MRLKGYDYRQHGAYFVTICAYRHAEIFGAIDAGVMMPNAIGRIVAEEWRRTVKLRPYVELDAFVLMPNHLHGIIAILRDDDQSIQQAASGENGDYKSGKLQAGSLGAIIGRFKGIVTRRVRELPASHQLQVLQRNYYDHIIRNEKSLQTIREYITVNPSRWAKDSYYNANGSDHSHL